MGMTVIGGGGGGGGSSLPPGADVEVEAGGDLLTALGSDNTVYVSGDISIVSSITLGAGQKVIWKPGITVTFTSDLTTTAGFILSSSYTLEMDVAGHVNFVGAHTGAFISGDGTGKINARGQYKLNAPDYRNTITSIKGWIEDIEWTMDDNAVSLTGISTDYLRIGNLSLIGGGTACRFRMTRVWANIVSMSGTYRVYASTLKNNYAFSCRDSYAGTLYRYGSSDWGILSDGGFISHTRCETASNTYIGSIDHGVIGQVSGTNARLLSGSDGIRNAVMGPGAFEEFTGETSTVGYTFNGVGFWNSTTLENLSRSRFIGGTSGSSITLASSLSDLVFTDHEFGSAVTFSGFGDSIRFLGCSFRSSETVPSGAKLVFVGCRFANFTNSSGSSSTFTDCEFTGTFTNSDGTNSRFKGCRNSSDETWMNNDGRIEFKATSTTDATKTQLFIDASALQFLLASNDVAHCGLKVTCVRDNQDDATFFIPTFNAKNDGGTTTVSAPGTLAALTPDDSHGTGSTLTVDVEADDTNDAPAIYITANASENWDTVAILTYSVVNN